MTFFQKISLTYIYGQNYMITLTKMVAVKDITISEIGRQNYEWRITVKVKQVWKEIDKNNSKKIRNHMILIDTMGNKIHASGQQGSIATKNLVEGNVYTFARFGTSFIKEGLRLTDHDFKISIKEFTLITPIEKVQINFPPNIFDLVQFSDISNFCLMRNKGKCFDIIGRLDYWTKIKQSNKNGHTSKWRMITIRNESYNLLDVKLYGYLAKEIEESIQNTNMGNQSILIITSTLANYDYYNKRCNVYSSYATRIFRNLLIPLVEDFGQVLNKTELSKIE